MGRTWTVHGTGETPVFPVKTPREARAAVERRPYRTITIVPFGWARMNAETGSTPSLTRSSS